MKNLENEISREMTSSLEDKTKGLFQNVKSSLEDKTKGLFQNVKKSAMILAAAGSLAACASNLNSIQTEEGKSYTLQEVPKIVTYREGEIKFENIFPGNYSAFDN